MLIDDVKMCQLNMVAEAIGYILDDTTGRKRMAKEVQSSAFELVVCVSVYPRKSAPVITESTSIAKLPRDSQQLRKWKLMLKH
jgi:hypothetical protein